MQRWAMVMVMVWSGALLAQPLESGADERLVDVTPRQAQLFAKLVQSAGFRCDSIYGVIRLAAGDGVSIFCNGAVYHYDVVNRGGRWLVTVQ